VLVVLVLESMRPWPTGDPSLQGEVAVALAFAALLSAWLLRASYRSARRRPDRLVFIALIGASLIHLATAVRVAFAGVTSPVVGMGPQLASVLMLVAFVLAAPAQVGVQGKRHGAARLAATGLVGGLLLAALTALVAGPTDSAANAMFSGTSSTVDAIVSGSLLLILALAFASRGPASPRDAGLLAAATVILAGVQFQGLLLPERPRDWVTPAEGFQVLAYGILLGLALRSYRRTQDRASEVALGAERLRIARDLHDGLVQDLAFIAAHGDRLARDLGGEHPIAVAARRALGVSRGAVVDLVATGERSTLAALRVIAGEIESRYDVQIAVGTTDESCAAGPQLDPTDRHEVVRIAREAMINAVRHGGARHVSVTLGSKSAGHLLLRVADDGCGLDDSAPPSAPGSGLGVPTMRARARHLGWHLSARSRSQGGTRLEVRA
jgi:signal transduction histidine kinase